MREERDLCEIGEPLEGFVERVTFRNPENGFTVLELNTGRELVTVVGVLPYAAEGESMEVRGVYETHPEFGVQFKAAVCRPKVPDTAAAILRWLSSGAVKGIGPSTARKLVDAFGERTLDVLAEEPERLTVIKGITPQKAAALAEEFKRRFGLREAILRLSRLGLDAEESMRVFRVLGPSAPERIGANPYLLCREELRFSFERADAVARNLGFSESAPERLEAGLLHVLRHNLNNGHTCLPKDKLLQTAKVLLGDEHDSCDAVCEAMLSAGTLMREIFDEREFVFLPTFFRAERYIARRLSLMLLVPPDPLPVTAEALERPEKEFGVVYDARQKSAIAAALSRGLLILTGGPGTGKTTTLRAVIRLLQIHDQKTVLCAPTGRAAKRMTELTGEEAKTVHRLLEADRGEGPDTTFRRNEQNPLEADAVIVDEFSMVDARLFENLLRALRPGCRLIMVGDIDQLPSVGAGNVLADLIRSERLPTVRLTRIFRQAQKSLIVTNAHKIVSGERPDLSRNDADFFFLRRKSPDGVRETVADLYARRLPAAYGYDPKTQIQVLCPSRIQPLGTAALNELLQSIVNPPAPGKSEWKRPGFILREGDKVIQTKNNYDIPWTTPREDGTGIFNGDVGILERIDRRAGILSVRFDDRLATYDFEQADDLEPAYAMTVHKSQGSEFDCVILPLLDPAPRLCYRNLLYTAVTRAKKQLIAVGSEASVYRMVSNDRRTLRYTGLERFLREAAE